MKTSYPPNRRNFRHCWDELAYLCKKADYYLHVKRIRSRASRFVIRLRQLLRTSCKKKGPIVAETAHALICEHDGRWKQAAKYRKRELEMVLRVYHISKNYSPEALKFLLQGRTKEEMSTQLLRIRETYIANASKDEIATIEQLIRRLEAAECPLLSSRIATR